MQYFLGLKGFTQKPVFDPSHLVHIRKRIDLNVFESLTDELIRKGLNIQQTAVKESKNDENDDSSPVGVMFKDKSNSCDDCIVKIHQQHVRPIVGGKAN